MTRSARWIAMVLTTLGLVSIQAQQGNTNQGNPPRGGSQPPAAGVTNQNQANQGMFGGINQTAWFMEPSIRAQLQINQQQANRLNQSYSDFFSTYNRTLPQIQPGTTATPEQQQAILNAGNQFYTNYGHSADSILDQNQRARFNQLALQYRGYGVFWDPTYAERLRLNEDQIARLKRYETDYNQQLTTGMRNRDTYGRRFGEIRQDMNNNINTVFTEEQRRLWKELVGDPYTFKVR